MALTEKQTEELRSYLEKLRDLIEDEDNKIFVFDAQGDEVVDVDPDELVIFTLHCETDNDILPVDVSAKKFSKSLTFEKRETIKDPIIN